ncbi:hypothetical protein [Clostridium sp. YIM B02569]|uniref:hypothetical protein n=1 Tax=Clostridium sp. YIM B02569 TaxID=2911967 RepID=UPI001EEC1FC8|nr:hypothetical protein [Clostridium sp. YIM B02569]
MKTLVIYDNVGHVYLQLTSDNNRIPQVGINYLEVEVPVGKTIKSIDVSITPNEPIYEDIPKSELELLKEQVNDLAEANAELTSTVAMGNTNA